MIADTEKGLDTRTDGILSISSAKSNFTLLEPLDHGKRLVLRNDKFGLRNIFLDWPNIMLRGVWFRPRVKNTV